MTAANLGHRAPIAFRRGQGAACSTDDRLEKEGRDGVWPQGQDFRLQFRGQMRDQPLMRNAYRQPVGIGSTDPAHRRQGPSKGPLAVFKAGKRRRHQGIAMPGPLPRNKPYPCWIAPVEMVLQRDLHRTFHRLGTACRIDHVGQSGGLGEDLAHLFQRVAGEQVAVAVGHLFHLRRHCRIHPCVTMADGKHRWPAGAVDVFLPVGVPKIDALAMADLRQTALRNVIGTWTRHRGFLLCAITLRNPPRTVNLTTACPRRRRACRKRHHVITRLEIVITLFYNVIT